MDKLIFIHPEAVIGENVVIHPFVNIDKGVVIGDNCEIRSFVSIQEGTTIGNDNKIFEGCVIGALPQEFSREDKRDSKVVIGNGNTIRENVVINRSINPGHTTSVGHKNYLMEGVHLAHDVEVGNECVLAFNSKITPNCQIDDHAYLGASTVLNKYCKVGKWSFLSAGSVIYKHVPPYVRVGGTPGEWLGINTTILRGNNFSESAIKQILFAYRLIYGNYSLFYALEKVKKQSPGKEEIDEIIRFMNQVKEKGIVGKEEIEEEGGSVKK
ncbi:acyl-ACP--UDP-N-acetylglucosamine O-acyltransferase [Parabacteroides sp. PF5-5]|uniref:acyl-ACP--UDP-N-acetylglucosamine O-acyltransferase n=1 Tax=unclassified Parabacteroides TaxID=2649774 RepID=UPI002473C71C|nr:MULTISPECIES: acyl-ACP--UDP-N-acetylglucosamine O-acyltransferase [unclassified Parabacteroides]MDH6303616.1 acyl-ACP--UDP-N-acetylglucosamine O-acyltransferase [Parabacteroides sp. PH5-39]MDH6314938.1 acyl-ACP--UDP-N-acetylglucosamine O-acyltransferase [Parabacteroides sp. PF5-13]MDH6318275.1 acyl-ACP--UDP-N-acetylglucosamine O-acyltransferase [Parabacteroides sp. PH5-13]MDH6321792.1 acyl-ACP--UDP-N-acetylglucosamine O-acyltransferase [Parabacteroides sp. PH5-8]MDH6325916.1 acyl-ACP--UDP-N